MSKIGFIAAAGLASVLFASAGSVFATDGAALYKAKLCATCHGADANTPLTPAYPKLAGQNAGYLLQQMVDIRDGKRANGMSMAMKPMVANLSDGDIKAIADWLATQ